MGRPKLSPQERTKHKAGPDGARIMYDSDFCQKTPETRAISQANLTPGRSKSKSKKPPKTPQKDLAKLNIIEFAENELGVSFKERPAQRVILKCLYGLKLTISEEVDEIKIYNQLTGKSEVNRDIFEELVEKDEADWGIGARGGKSFLVSIIALYESIVRAAHWRKYLRKDEVGYAIITATRQKQCEDIIQASCTNLLQNSKLAYLIAEFPLKAELKLTNGLSIISSPCNSTAARGLPIFLLVFDEIAHYRTEGVKADYTIHSALRPRQAQFPGAKCLKITTVGAKQGLFWKEFDAGFEVPSRLTIQAATRIVNPVIPQPFIDKEYKRDPDNAEREFGAIFAETVSGFFETCIDALKKCFSGASAEDMPYQSEFTYFAGIDQSGLSVKGDRWGFCISHFDRRINKVVVDVARSWQTKNLDTIVSEIALLCQTYHISELVADRYAIGFVENVFKPKGISIIVRELLPAIYTTFKTLVVADKLVLPDRKDLRDGLFLTQGFYGKSNTLSIGHERTTQGHADLADAVVTSCASASKERIYPAISYAEQTAARQKRAERQKTRYYSRFRR